MKKTRKALFLSVCSMILCVAMFLGTTMAWFTDSVTSGVNKIEAGNLDIEVEYKNDNTNGWSNLQGSTSVFSKGLWEPGHTEFVTLKVTNKGTLKLKYKALVTPVAENGGVNVDGKSFKLSDYMVFGTTTPAATETTYTRDTARAAVGTTQGLNVTSLTKENTLAVSAVEYITLVVYMPETVGNKANYKTGTQAPSIELGINFVATQVEAESDSFGDNYDADADDDYNATFDPAYDYFPQVAVSEPVTAGQYVTVTEKQTINNEEVTLVEVKVPADSIATDADEVKVTVVPQGATQSTQQAAGLKVEIANDKRVINNYDIKVTGIKDAANIEDNKEVEVQIYVGTGLSNVKVYHNGIEMTGITYNATTGYVNFKTKSCSDYTVVYDSLAYIKDAAAKIGANAYATFKDAIAAVGNAETIIIQKDIENAEGLAVEGGKNFTVDFKGKKYTINKPGAGSPTTETNGFQLLAGSTITFKNGTIVLSEENLTLATVGKNISRVIQNYANLTLKDMTIDASNLYGSGNYALSFNNGTSSIVGNTSIKLKSGATTGFDVYYWPNGGYGEVEVTVDTTGNIEGTIELDADGTDASYKNTLKLVNGDFKDGYNLIKGNLVITGGTYYADPSAYIYTTVYKAYPDTKLGTWKVQEIKPVVKNVTKSTEYKTWEAALAAASSGDELLLLETIYPTQNMTFDKSLTIDMNGFGFVRAAEASGGYKINLIPGCDLAMKNGTWAMNATFGDICAEGSNGTCNVTYTDVTFDNLNNPTTEEIKAKPGNSTELSMNAFKANMQGNLVVNATFTNCKFNNAKVEFSGYNSGNKFVATFTGCTFVNLTNSEAIRADGYGMTNACSLTVTDCNFDLTATSSVYAVEAERFNSYNNSAIEVTLSGNTVKGAIADSENYVVNQWASVKFYSASATATVTESNTTLQGVATK